MDADSLRCLLSGDYGLVEEALNKFNKQNSQVFNFMHFTSTGQWVLIWNKLFAYLADPGMPHRVGCLMAIKVLSRDKTYLNETVTVEQLDLLLQLAGIGPLDACEASEEVQVEALKCLSNMIFQSTKCQEMCLSNASTEGIIRRVKMYKEAPYGYDIKYFDMKLLFLLTAINCDIRAKVRDQLHGLVYLVETLDLFMGQSATFKEFSDKDLDLVNEVLKVLFNLTVRTSDNLVPEEEEATQFHRLVTVLHDLFFYRTLNRDKIVSLHSNIVNLLTSVPVSCYVELVTSLNAKCDSPPACVGDDPVATVVPFESKNMYVLHVLVEFLRKNFQKAEKKSDQYELLSPILTVLIKAIRADAINRRYVRSVVLPPLRDVRDRPEIGKELRNYLCSLLTSPCTQIADLSAELLFVLCKENVGRMIKYTGYGNAAGLFANRGLLGGRTAKGCEQYSSDSEDSDTEEYKQLQHAINPVLGCYEPPKPNPLEGMSEERKEYEAMELVKLMDKLQRQGVIQPCKIGEDGRPQAVEHIMELQEEIPEQQRDHKRKT
ncbi:AGAP010793-PA-like protein [Anopheles sinensis]|uniref:AGAP010793-PA-like protein n=1 Tax=Anopheles sinensis TaxID=74873 RepID=A0A084VB41_ANOSI|nr:AGAP010793-PA-like protein [Anopheles sinensis]